MFDSPRGPFAASVLLLTICTIWTTAQSPASQAPGQQAGTVPVLVELFTSEGCSSCPPADRLAAELVERGGPDGIPVIVLAEHVDYWNRLGWEDPFSSPEFTRRQQAYAAALSSEVFTPQMVVDGSMQVIGSERAAVESAIRQAAARPKAPLRLDATREEKHLRVSIEVPAASENARSEVELFVAVTEDGLASDVTRGENAGRRLPHAAVVRALKKVKSWKPEKPRRFDERIALEEGWDSARVRVVAFLQARANRAVLGAASVAPAEDHTRLDGR